MDHIWCSDSHVWLEIAPLCKMNSFQVATVLCQLHRNWCDTYSIFNGTSSSRYADKLNADLS